MVFNRCVGNLSYLPVRLTVRILYFSFRGLTSFLFSKIQLSTVLCSLSALSKIISVEIKF